MKDGRPGRLADDMDDRAGGVGGGVGSAGSRQAGSTLRHLLARRPDGDGGALKRIPARPWGLSHVNCEIFWRDDPKIGERAAGA